jgi:hypothetical protein
MKSPPKLPLRHEYHDGRLDAVEVGPRREVTLHIGLDPVWNDGEALVRRIHFSAIKNFEQVADFFRVYAVKVGEASLDTVIGIVRPSKARIGIDLDHLGYVELEGAKVREL